MAAALPTVAEELLSEMAAAVRDGAPILDEHLLSLKFVFGSSAIQALDLVDRQSITLISSPSGRRVYQVLGSSGKTYICLTSCHYCSCPAFAFSVLRRGDSLLCKHLLAVYLSRVMRTCQQLSTSDKQLTDILLMEKKQAQMVTGEMMHQVKVDQTSPATWAQCPELTEAARYPVEMGNQPRNLQTS